MATLRKGPKLVLTLLICLALFFGAKTAMSRGLLPTPGFLKPAKIQTEANIASVQDVGPTGTVTALDLPSTEPANVSGPELRCEVWAWNAHTSLLYAIGGPKTTQGSLFAKAGINASVRRNDDTNQMQNDQISYGTQYAAGNRNPSTGVNCVTIMGSQAGGYLASVNAALSKVGDRGVIVTVPGRSDGEDAVMGPAEWKSNPSSMLGKAVYVVPLEGDADLLKWYVKNNDLVYNPDPTTFDSNAVNIIAAKDYVDAADKFNAHYCDRGDAARRLVVKGRQTTTKVDVCGDGLSTWTPADAKAARGRGGFTRVISTHEVSGIMPNVMILNAKWAQDNRELVTKAVAAIGQAGEQIVNRPEALTRGCEISAQVYAEETPQFWCTFYKGTVEKGIPLGGSRVSTLGDVANWFGLRPGTQGTAQATYTTFGKMLMEHYKDQLPHGFPSADEAFDVSYARAALDAAPATQGEVATYTAGVSGTRVARRSWHINFKTGSAVFTPEAQAQMADLLNEITTGGKGLAVEVQGHTDSQGEPDANMALSEARAFAVKQWLERTAPGDFPQNRITPRAFGETSPAATNLTPDGRAQNRRVDILLREAQ